MENQGDAQGVRAPGYTTSPHADVQATAPGVAAAAPQKPGIGEKVKAMLGRHGASADSASHQAPVYGDATPATGSAESTRVGCLDTLKAKTGIGHGLAPAQTRAHGGGVTGQTAADPSASPDFNSGTNVNSSAAVHGGWPHPTNPNQPGGTVVHEPHHGRETHNHPTGLPNPFSRPNPNATASGYGGAQPTNPTGVTNAQGGAVLADHQGIVHEGPRDDTEKKEGFMSKIMDKLHSPKGKPATNNTTTTTPNPY